MEGQSSTKPEKPKQMGGKRRGKGKVSIEELKAEMAVICEEQVKLREGQREVQQKFQEIESKISSIRGQGNSPFFT